ncbi:MAG: nuclease-related domain-containing protein [Candidatus Aenigmarchaeota archaeon]|nr:nuclease-related domain-containing protein [Candidatus Aenigmarchaeota archaeon]
MVDIEEIKNRILSGEEIENIVEEIGWKQFEELVAEIFKKHDFLTFHNFRFKTDRRFEVDILAFDKNYVFVIDCKQWSRGRYKKTGLKYAVEGQKYRLEELKNFLKDNPIAKSKLKITEKTKFIPLIVTLFEEDLLKHEDTIIVPVWKLNQFLLTLSEYI